jgi:hypothetical protein
MDERNLKTRICYQQEGFIENDTLAAIGWLIANSTAAGVFLFKMRAKRGY